MRLKGNEADPAPCSCKPGKRLELSAIGGRRADGRRFRIAHRGVTLADARHAARTREASRPQSFDIARADIVATAQPWQTARRCPCEWRGSAVGVDVAFGEEWSPDVAWSQPDPTATFAALRDPVAFHAVPPDEWSIAAKTVVPQPGGFCGVRITSDLAGPFEGASRGRHR
jgi:uncharacterized protein (DUF427 family)